MCLSEYKPKKNKYKYWTRDNSDGQIEKCLKQLEQPRKPKDIGEIEREVQQGLKWLNWRELEVYQNNDKRLKWQQIQIHTWEVKLKDFFDATNLLEFKINRMLAKEPGMMEIVGRANEGFRQLKKANVELQSTRLREQGDITNLERMIDLFLQGTPMDYTQGDYEQFMETITERLGANHKKITLGALDNSNVGEMMYNGFKLIARIVGTKGEGKNVALQNLTNIPNNLNKMGIILFERNDKAPFRISEESEEKKVRRSKSEVTDRVFGRETLSVEDEKKSSGEKNEKMEKKWRSMESSSKKRQRRNSCEDWARGQSDDDIENCLKIIELPCKPKDIGEIGQFITTQCEWIISREQLRIDNAYKYQIKEIKKQRQLESNIMNFFNAINMLEFKINQMQINEPGQMEAVVGTNKVFSELKNTNAELQNLKRKDPRDSLNNEIMINIFLQGTPMDYMTGDYEDFMARMIERMGDNNKQLEPVVLEKKKLGEMMYNGFKLIAQIVGTEGENKNVKLNELANIPNNLKNIGIFLFENQENFEISMISRIEPEKIQKDFDEFKKQRAELISRIDNQEKTNLKQLTSEEVNKFLKTTKMSLKTVKEATRQDFKELNQKIKEDGTFVTRMIGGIILMSDLELNKDKTINCLVITKLEEFKNTLETKFNSKVKKLRNFLIINDWIHKEETLKKLNIRLENSKLKTDKLTWNTTTEESIWDDILKPAHIAFIATRAF